MYLSEQVKSRNKAISDGDKFYFTGKPCKHGGIAQRRVSNYQCTCEACTKKDRENAKKFALENPDHVSKYKKIWQEENKKKISEERKKKYREDPQYRAAAIQRAENRRKEKYEEIREKARSFYRDNKDRIALQNEAYRKRNFEAVRLRRRRYYLKNKHWLAKKQAEYGKKNRGSLLVSERRWREDNRERVREYQAKRRAGKRNAMPAWYGDLDKFVIQQAYELLPIRERMHGFKWQIDHMIPIQALKAVGLHCAHNIQVIPERVNLSKRNRMIYTDPMEWLNHEDLKCQEPTPPKSAASTTEATPPRRKTNSKPYTLPCAPA